MRISSLLCTVAAALAAAGCGNALGPQEWTPTPDTVTLFSVSRPDYTGLPSGLDFVIGQTVPIEASTATGFDVVLAQQDGNFVFLPEDALVGVTTGAGVSPVTGTSFDALQEAPSDTSAYVHATAVPLQVGGIYVVRSRQSTCGYVTGQWYAKVQALSVDQADGTAQFQFVRNPYCNDRNLLPPSLKK